MASAPGDGSFLMNCQELATAAIEKLNIKILLLNNQHLGMVVQWEDRFYKVRGFRLYGVYMLGVFAESCWFESLVSVMSDRSHTIRRLYKVPVPVALML